MNLYALRKAAAVAKLDEVDPTWRERFLGDWERAEEFYNPGRTRTVGAGHPEQPPDVVREPYQDPDECGCDDPFCESCDE